MLNMKIRFKNLYPPIGDFGEIELPSFACITGQNGCGKTRFFSGIEEGAFEVFDESGHHLRSVLRFDYMSFFVQQPRISLDSQRGGADLSPSNLTVLPLKDQEINQWNHLAREAQTLVEGAIRDTLLNGINQDHVAVACGLVKQFHTFDKDVLREVLAKRLREVVSDADADVILKNYNKYYEKCLSMDGVRNILRLVPDGVNIFHPDLIAHLQQRNTASVVLGQWFFSSVKNYCVERDNFEKEQHSRIRSSDREMFSRNDLVFPGMSPWEAINEILGKYDCNGYFVDEGDIPLPEAYIPLEQYNPRLQLTNKVTGAKVGIDELSSGEKVLFALVMSIYEMQRGGVLPQVLLLDEVGTNLHPSQMSKFIEVIRETFVEKGVNVIMATHSPSTVALMPEGSVFVMRSPGEVGPIMQLVKNEDAVEILTEGFLTYAYVKKVKSANKAQIYVEGDTDKRYFERACQLLDPDLLDNVNFLTLPSGGAAPLITKYKNLKPAADDEAVSFKSKVVFVLDCDVSGGSGSAGGVLFKYKIGKIDENPVEKGIENLFPLSTLRQAEENGVVFTKEDIRTTISGGTGETTKRKWDVAEGGKRGLCEWVCNNGTAEDFAYFRPVLDEIKRIISNK